MQTGWLDPTGYFYPCEVFDHVEVARDIVENMGVSFYGTAPDDVLLELGWAKVTRSLLGMKEQHFVWEKHLTGAQKEFLKPYFEDNDEPVSMVAVVKWEYELDGLL